MKKTHRLLLSMLICAWFSTPALLAQEAESPRHSAAVNLISAILPFLMIAGVLWLFLRKSQRTPFMQRSLQYYERSEQHMQRMEEIGERIAAALERAS